MNGVGGCGVGGSRRGRIYQNDQENAQNESESAWWERTSPFLCPNKGEIGLMERALDNLTCEIDLNDGGDPRSGGTWRSCASDCCWMTLYARTGPCRCEWWSVLVKRNGKDDTHLFFTLESVLVRALRNPSVDVLECVLACLFVLGVGSSSLDVRGVEALEGGPDEVHELVLPALWE